MSQYQGGYPQGGYPQGGYQQPPQGGGQPGQNNNSGFDNHIKIQVIGRMAKDPESKMVNSSKVATSKIAINHRGQNADTDFWFIEVWGNEGSDSLHNFLVNHCPKGRRVFIEGIPFLKQQKDANGNFSYFPTIKIFNLIGLDGGNNQGGQQSGQQQGGYQQPPTGHYSQQPPAGYQPSPAPPQGGYPPPPPAGYQPPPAGYQPPPAGYPPAQQGGFPPNPPGGYGAPNPGGFPPNPPQQ